MTYIYRRISVSDLTQALKQDQYGGWSYEGAKALAEHLEQLAEDTGTPIELDVVALRCEFSEYATLAAFNEAYNSADPFSTWEEVAENTTVIRFGTNSAITGEF